MTRSVFTRERRAIRWLPRHNGGWVILILVALIGHRLYRHSPTRHGFSFDSHRLYHVERVIDGDTLLLAGGTRVRLIGVDTPETKHPTMPVDPLGIEAAEFTSRHVEGLDVTLRFDRERRDRYHRVLAYVYVGNWCLNEELILAGYSRAETRFPYRADIKKRFRAAEEKSRESRRGIWSRQPL